MVDVEGGEMRVWIAGVSDQKESYSLRSVSFESFVIFVVEIVFVVLTERQVQSLDSV